MLTNLTTHPTLSPLPKLNAFHMLSPSHLRTPLVPFKPTQEEPHAETRRKKPPPPPASRVPGPPGMRPLSHIRSASLKMSMKGGATGVGCQSPGSKPCAVDALRARAALWRADEESNAAGWMEVRRDAVLFEWETLSPMDGHMGQSRSGSRSTCERLKGGIGDKMAPWSHDFPVRNRSKQVHVSTSMIVSASVCLTIGLPTHCLRKKKKKKKKKTLPKLAHQTRARKPRVTGFLARLGRSQTTSHRRSTLRPGEAHCTVSSMSSSIRSETTSSVTASTGRDGTVTAVLNAGDGGGFFVRTSRFFDLGRGRNLVEAKRASESTIHIDLFTKLRKGSVYRLYTGSR